MEAATMPVALNKEPVGADPSSGKCFRLFKLPKGGSHPPSTRTRQRSPRGHGLDAGENRGPNRLRIRRILARRVHPKVWSNTRRIPPKCRRFGPQDRDHKTAFSEINCPPSAMPRFTRVNTPLQSNRCGLKKHCVCVALLSTPAPAPFFGRISGGLLDAVRRTTAGRGCRRRTTLG
jgi:hypothetical protein